MGLVSLFFIVSLTLLYAGKSLSEKPAWLSAALDKIRANVDALSFWGLLYGLVAFILTPLMIRHGNVDMLVRMTANLLIVLMSLPLALDGLLEKHREKIPGVIAAELRRAGAFVSAREKIVGYVAAVFSLLLFATLFR